MELTALSLLPGVHASLAGIFFAFFTAYVFFVYQKINEINDDLDSVISEIKVSRTTCLVEETDFSIESIERDQQIIKEISLNLSTGLSLTESQLRFELEEAYKALGLFINIIENTYFRFKFLPKIENFDIELYKDSYQKFDHIHGILKYYEQFYISNIVKELSEIHNLILLKIKERIPLETIKEFESLGANLSKDQLSQQVQQRIDIETDYLDNRLKWLSSFEDTLQSFYKFYDNDYKNIKKLISKKDRIKTTHNLYKISINVFVFLILILVLGIFIPILLVAKSECLKSYFFVSWYFQVLFSIITFIPYLVLSLIGIRQLKEG